MKQLLLILLTCNLFAYELGDRLSTQTIEKLQLAKEKYTFIAFFASWCGSCRKELPQFNLLKLDKNSALLGVDVDKNIDKAKAFQKELALTFPIYDDTKQEIIRKFSPLGMPSLYLVYDEKVLYVKHGAIDDVEDEIATILRSLNAK